MAADADDVAEVEQADQRELSVTEPVEPHPHLEPLVLGLDVREGALALAAVLHHAPGDANLGTLGRVLTFSRRRCGRPRSR